MSSLTRWLPYALAIVLTVLFMASRWYQIHETLLFFIDIGRDGNVLWDWAQTGRPPLLGPQTSALPFNQSAVYFYLLYPLFLLTGFSAFSTIYTATFVYIGVFWALLILLRKEPQTQWSLLLVWILVLIHPQFVIQTRFVWNPTFVAPAVLWAVVSFLQLRRQWRWTWVVSLAVSIAMAASFNYSAIPTLMAVAVGGVWYFRKKAVWLVLTMVVALALVNAPTIFFEVRHQFPLTKMVLYQPKLAQTETSIPLKIRDITQFGLEMPSSATRELAAVALVLVLTASYYWLYTKKSTQQLRDFETVAVLLLVTLGITFLMPVSVLSHYIFGYLILVLLLIAFLPKRVAVTVILIMATVWLRPSQLARYLQPARRTVADMERCFQTVCQEITEPLYVSVQAGFHPFHAAQEHRFLLRKNGCQVPPIDEQPTAARLMAVVADDSTYDHGQTAYNELTQFGPSQQTRVFNCQENFQVYILER